MKFWEMMSQKIRTYLLIIGVNSHLDEYDTIKEVYDIDNVDISSSRMNPSYNIHNLSPMNNTLKFFPVNGNFDKILKSLEISVQGIGSFKKKLCVIKFWGNISQEFTFSGSFLTSYGDDGFEVTYDHGSFSEKNADIKQYAKLLIPFIRDEKLNNLLSNI